MYALNSDQFTLLGISLLFIIFLSFIYLIFCFFIHSRDVYFEYVLLNYQNSKTGNYSFSDVFSFRN